MGTAGGVTSSAVAAGAVTAIAWMSVRFVTAVTFLLTPMRDLDPESESVTIFAGQPLQRDTAGLV